MRRRERTAEDLATLRNTGAKPDWPPDRNQISRHWPAEAAPVSA